MSDLSKNKGYKKTKLGLIPENWKVEKLSQLTEKIGSGITPRGGSEIYTTNGHPFIRSQNVGWGRLLLEDMAHIPDEIHKSMSSTVLKFGDVLLNITGASIGRSTLVTEEIKEGNVNQHVCIIRPKKSIIDESFLNSFLISWNAQKQIESFQAGGNRQGLNFQQIGLFKIPLPPLPEQKKIAEILSSWDRAIETLEQLIAKKEEMKRGLMQELLTGKVRFEEFVESKNVIKTKIGMIPEDWRVTELKSILKESYLGGNYENSETNTGIPLIKMGNLERGCFKSDKIEYVPTDIVYEKKHILKKGYLLLNTRNTLDLVGKVAIWRNELELALFNSNLLRMIFNDKVEVSNQFMNYFFNSHTGLKQLRSYATGTTSVAAIYSRDLIHLKVPLPSVQEQRKICSIISTLDLEIEKLSSEIELLKIQKKGLMQQLLTGRMRV